AEAAAANDLVFRDCEAWPTPLDQRLALLLSQAAKHLDPGDQLFGSQAEVERGHIIRTMAADGSMLAFQRAIEFAAQQTLCAQLPEQRDFQLECGLAEEDLFEPGSV